MKYESQIWGKLYCLVVEKTLVPQLHSQNEK